MRLRIIAGEARGRSLKSFAAPGMRPTADRVRESWFSMMGPRVAGCRFLDLYAGTGAVGIEALSRGASRCVLVEKTRQGTAVIRENLGVLGELPAGAVEVRQGDATTAVALLERAGESFDLIFADPPYADLESPGKVLAKLGSTQALLAEGAIVTIQHSRRVPLPERAGRLKRYEERTYGDTLLSLYRVEEEVTTA